MLNLRKLRIDVFSHLLDFGTEDKSKLAQSWKNTLQLSCNTDFKWVLECYFMREYMIFLNKTKQIMQVLLEFISKIMLLIILSKSLQNQTGCKWQIPVFMVNHLSQLNEQISLFSIDLL